MDFWELIYKEIKEAHQKELEKMEHGVFRNDSNAYNESVGFLRGLRYVTECVEDLYKRQNEQVNPIASRD